MHMHMHTRTRLLLHALFDARSRHRKLLADP
jgi:hypothetical protein